MQRDPTIKQERVVVIDRDALTRQARATLFRTRRNAAIDLREKATSRPVPEERAPLLTLFDR
jgi:tRNA(Ile2) C34 agmatinyltransferase TiaS